MQQVNNALHHAALTPQHMQLVPAADTRHGTPNACNTATPATPRAFATRCGAMAHHAQHSTHVRLGLDRQMPVTKEKPVQDSTVVSYVVQGTKVMHGRVNAGERSLYAGPRNLLPPCAT